jgi:hypothetical protein
MSTGAFPAEVERRVQEVLSTTQDVPTQIDQIAKIRGWHQPSPDSKYFSLLQEYIQGKIGLQDTTSKINASIEEAGTKKDGDDQDLWLSVIHSAKRIPYRDTERHSKLVSLVENFPNRRDAPNEGAVNSQYPHNSMSFRESLNDAPGIAAGYSSPEISAWANINYFYAELTRKEMVNLWIYAVWAMRAALEKVPTDDDGSGGNQPATAAQKMDALVPAAAAWVFGLGKKLFEKEEDLTPKSKLHGNPGRGGELWNGPAEFSKKRWALWKKRFGEIATNQELSEDTRGVAKEAVAAMEKAESP